MQLELNVLGFQQQWTEGPKVAHSSDIYHGPESQGRYEKIVNNERVPTTKNYDVYTEFLNSLVL